MKSRSISIFEEYIQSEKTREQYLFHLRKFAEFGLLNELKEYEETMKNSSVIPNFDPIEIFSINNKIIQRDGSYVTEARAIRNLIDHHKYDLDVTSSRHNSF